MIRQRTASLSVLARRAAGPLVSLLLVAMAAGACAPKVAEAPPGSQAPVAGEPGSFPTFPTLPLPPLPGLAAESLGKARVALLLPLSGHSAELGKAMLRAAELALFEAPSNRLLLLVHDTGDTPESAAAAAEAAIAQGASFILGPLFAPQVAAAALPARTMGANMVSFSTDLSVAGQGVWVMGILPRLQVERVVGYAASHGRTRVAALAPATAYGDAVVDALGAATTRYGIATAAIQRYQPDETNLNPVVEGLGTDFDAVLLPEGGVRAQLLAPLLAYHEIDPTVVKLLGTALWDDPALGQEPTLVGGWFAAPAPERWRAFRERYLALYGQAPPRIASIAYDATSLAAALAEGFEPGRFGALALTQPNGFSGIDGIFRFMPDGSVERGLAVLEVGTDSARVIDPAPAGFATMGF